MKNYISENTGILIRIDDVCENMDWELMKKLEKLFDEHSIKPVLGVIYIPCNDETYWGTESIGSYYKKGNLDGISIQVCNNTNDRLRIISSRSHQSNKLQTYLDQLSDYEIINIGSSIKFCKLAEGKADLYPRFGSTSEWDIAAGHIILTEAGGELESVDHKKILYNNKESVINPHFIASCRLNN